MAEKRLQISGMTCANCVRHVTHALEGVDGVTEARVNLSNETAYVQGDVPEAHLVRAVEKAGYGVVLGEAPDAARTHLRQTLLAAAFTVPLFAYTMAYLPLGGARLPFDAYLAWALATPVQFVAGWPFYQGAWRALRNRSATMDTLVALGTSAAYGLSAYLALQGAHAHGTYFETSAVIITLVGLGKTLEARAKRQTTAAIRELLDLRPDTAERKTGDGWEEVPVDDVRVGDVLRVKPGGKVPVDGTVQDGQAYADESHVTGEDRPVRKGAGDELVGASVVTGGSLVFEATRVGEETLLGQIVAMVEDANSRQAPMQRIADRISGVFVPVVLALALLAGTFWIVFGTSWIPADQDAGIFGFLIAVSVVVISCPCALGLATPTAIMVGTGLGARHGILIKGGEALERLHHVDTIVVDKTGTLTEGRPALVGMQTDLHEDFFLALAAATESASEHPLAHAILTGAKDRGVTVPVARDFVSHDGRGVEATVDGVLVRMGSRRFVAERTPWDDWADARQAQGQSVVWVGHDGEPVGVLAVADPIRKTTPEAVAAWQAAGKRVVLMTGDQEPVARAVAAQVGIEEVHAGVLPADKAGHVQRMQKEGAVVAMVGDGINDAPALAQADVGIAMGTGTDIAKETGDIVLVHGDLMQARAALELGDRTVRKVYQNLGWALVYNAALIPVAMGVLYPSLGILIHPMMAGAAMALSSVSVVGNALTLRRWTPT